MDLYQNQVPCSRISGNYDAEGSNRTLRQWIDEVDALLEEAVRIRLMSEVPLGVFLSGGLDSSAIVVYMYKAKVQPLKTFTIGFDRPEWDESADAEVVAKHFQTDHHLLTLREQDLTENWPGNTLLVSSQKIGAFSEPDRFWKPVGFFPELLSMYVY